MHAKRTNSNAADQSTHTHTCTHAHIMHTRACCFSLFLSPSLPSPFAHTHTIELTTLRQSVNYPYSKTGINVFSNALKGAQCNLRCARTRALLCQRASRAPLVTVPASHSPRVAVLTWGMVVCPRLRQVTEHALAVRHLSVAAQPRCATTKVVCVCTAVGSVTHSVTQSISQSELVSECCFPVQWAPCWGNGHT